VRERTNKTRASGFDLPAVLRQNALRRLVAFVAEVASDAPAATYILKTGAEAPVDASDRSTKAVALPTRSRMLTRKI